VPGTFTLPPEQRDEFDRRGVMRLPGFYPAADIAPMAERLWADLAAHNAHDRPRLMLTEWIARRG
jgi:hypothetical protein